MFTIMCPKEQQTNDNLILKTTVLSLKYLINLALVVSLGDVEDILIEARKNKHLPDNWYCEINYNSRQ